jgi:hypothetical protein
MIPGSALQAQTVSVTRYSGSSTDSMTSSAVSLTDSIDIGLFRCIQTDCRGIGGRMETVGFLAGSCMYCVLSAIGFHPLLPDALPVLALNSDFFCNVFFSTDPCPRLPDS